ncbi:putative Uncharacterized protein family (UPF0227) [Trypanosoma vivax]|nr:putative Uncharacterized protein family (UPF0227) [Trypanosoma vivax]
MEQHHPGVFDSAGVVQNVSGSEGQVADAPGEELQYYYDPTTKQSYYYDPNDGNYYYYTPAEEVAGAGAETVPAPEAAVGEQPAASPESVSALGNERRTMDLEDWEPPMTSWFSGVVLSMFFSLGFRLYLLMLMYSAAILQFVVSLSWTFQVLYQLYSPARPSESIIWRRIYLIVVFILLSVTVVTAHCTLWDMMKGLWHSQREQRSLWGMTMFAKGNPPTVLYAFIIMLTTVAPFLWCLIEGVLEARPIVYLLGLYAFSSTMAIACLVFICYIWFYFLSVRRKLSAFGERAKLDDFSPHQRAVSNTPGGEVRKRWYHTSVALEEYGLDEKTLRWNAVVFTMGCVPLFGLYSGVVLSTSTLHHGIIWGAVGSLSISLVYVVSWLTLLRTRSHWAIFLWAFLVISFLAVGVVSSALQGAGTGIGILLALLVASQGTFTRKRTFTLTRAERLAKLNIDTASGEQSAEHRGRHDMYLCCCPGTFMSVFRCFGVKKYFGYRHPDVARVERQFNLENITLRTDQRLLMCWWIVVTVSLAFVIGVGHTLAYNFAGEVAEISGLPIIGSNPDLPLCATRFNTNGVATLKLYDLSLLSALSYTVGSASDIDFTTWFSFIPNFIRQHPLRPPPNVGYAANVPTVPFSDYVDLSSDFHIVTLNSNNWALSLLRNLDNWSSAISLQVAACLSPFVNTWPQQYKELFAYGISFFQRWLPHSDPLDSVSNYLDDLIDEGKKERILLLGHGFNGGYAKELSARFGLPFVVINPTNLQQSSLNNTMGRQLLTIGALFPMLGIALDTADTIQLPCSSSYSSISCSRIETTVDTLRELCGDPVVGR